MFEDAGFKPGDTVALLLDNRPEYVALWLGLAKAGIVTALINYNLRDKPLLHSIQIADSKAIIFGTNLNDGNATRSIPMPDELYNQPLSVVQLSKPYVTN